MSRYDLTDFEWRVIEPLLPNKPRGVPRVDDRRVLNGIFWVLRSGAPWRDLPERYDTADMEVQRDNPFLSHTEMFRVVTRSLDLYRRRHAGRPPARVMVHKSTEFKPAEIDGCFEALKHIEAVDLVQVVEDNGWQAVRWEKDRYDPAKSFPDGYPVKRGTLLGLSGKDALLWMHGAVDGLGRRSYFQGGKGTPRPVRLVRHAGHGSWDDTARAALALSKMNWNNDGLYDPLPVTMSYAKTLAQVIKRMPAMGKGTYQFRFFM